MLTFTNAAEQSAWTMAEALSEKALIAMKHAEEAYETYRSGKMAMREEFRARGRSVAEGTIRWKATSRAQMAWSDYEFYMAQASMYNNAAATQYAKALYLKGR